MSHQNEQTPLSKEVNLHSDLGFIQQVVLVLLIPLLILVFYAIMNPFEGEFSPVTLIFEVGLIALMVFLLFKLATAKIDGRYLIINQIFQKERKIELTSIVSLDTFTYSRAKYLSITFQENEKDKTIWVKKPNLFLNNGVDVQYVLANAIEHQINQPDQSTL
jgi:hypothetical protein